MTALLTGTADTLDVPASPMPVAIKPANKIVRIVIVCDVSFNCYRYLCSTRVCISPCAFFLIPPHAEGY
jgi:hypothetical protein